VVLLQVVEPPSAIAALGTGGIIGPDALYLHQVEAKRYLDTVAGRLQAKGLRVRTVLGLGTPAFEIAATAKAEHADLIAMTTHGRSGFKRAIFGSVAEEVLRSADVPVLAIRKPAVHPRCRRRGRSRAGLPARQDEPHQQPDGNHDCQGDRPLITDRFHHASPSWQPACQRVRTTPESWKRGL